MNGVVVFAGFCIAALWICWALRPRPRPHAQVSWRRVHLALTILWALLAIPTLLWWRESILWIAFMSLYANFAGHWAAFQAAHAEEAQRDG